MAIHWSKHCAIKCLANGLKNLSIEQIESMICKTEGRIRVEQNNLKIMKRELRRRATKNFTVCACNPPCYGGTHCINCGLLIKGR